MMVTRDLVGGIGTIAIGAVYLAYAARIRVSALDDTVGPAGMPKAYGIIMVGLGIAIAAGALVKAVRARRAGDAVRGEWDGQGYKILRASGLLLIGVMYLLLVSYTGYGVGIALLIFATAFYQGAPRTWRLIAVSIGGAAGMWAIFVLLLGVSMPRGLLLPG